MIILVAEKSKAYPSSILMPGKPRFRQTCRVGCLVKSMPSHESVLHFGIAWGSLKTSGTNKMVPTNNCVTNLLFFLKFWDSGTYLFNPWREERSDAGLDENSMSRGRLWWLQRHRAEHTKTSRWMFLEMRFLFIVTNQYFHGGLEGLVWTCVGLL